MQTSSLHSMPDPHLIYMEGYHLSQSVSGFAPLDGEKKPGLMVSEFKMIKHVFFTLVISVACEKD